MGKKQLFLLSNVVIGLSISILLIMSKLCFCDNQYIATISPGMEASQMNYIDNDSMFLVSNNRIFGFGFVSAVNDYTKFLLVIVHKASSTVLWTANRALPVSNTDDFVFDKSGNAFLKKDGTVIWSTNTVNKGVSSMVLQDTGNLVLLGSKNNSTVIWQSFDFPTDTLIPSQDFKEGMKLTSEPSQNNLTYVLEIKSGNVISEKSDVYSYGMVLLEIIGRRKNYDPNETSEKSYFPRYAFKMIEEGKLRDIIDSELKMDDDECDDRVHCAISVALWCTPSFLIISKIDFLDSFNK